MKWIAGVLDFDPHPRRPLLASSLRCIEGRGRKRVQFISMNGGSKTPLEIFEGGRDDESHCTVLGSAVEGFGRERRRNGKDQ